MSEKVIIRRYSVDDIDEVRAVMLASYGSEATATDVFDWWHFGCPVASSGFMVAEVDGRIAGLQPMEFFPLALGGRRLRGAVLTGVVVHPNFRRRGLFMSLIKACEEEAWRQGADIVTTMPNDRSYPGFIKLGYTDPGRRHLMLCPLDEGRVFAKMLRSPFWAASLAWAARPIFRTSRWQLGRADSNAKEIETLPLELGTLAEMDRACFPGLRIARGNAWLRWRYLQSPHRKYRLIAAFQSSADVTGLMVTTQEVRDAIRVGYIMDWMVQDLESFSALTIASLARLQADGVAVAVAVVSSKSQIRALAAHGFWRVPPWAPLKRFYTVFRANPTMDASLKAVLERIDSWHQTLGDWDNL